jgi:hypothetical protein
VLHWLWRRAHPLHDALPSAPNCVPRRRSPPNRAITPMPAKVCSPRPQNAATRSVSRTRCIARCVRQRPPRPSACTNNTRTDGSLLCTSQSPPHQLSALAHCCASGICSPHDALHARQRRGATALIDASVLHHLVCTHAGVVSANHSLSEWRTHLRTVTGAHLSSADPSRGHAIFEHASAPDAAADDLAEAGNRDPQRLCSAGLDEAADPQHIAGNAGERATTRVCSVHTRQGQP